MPFRMFERGIGRIAIALDIDDDHQHHRQPAKGIKRKVAPWPASVTALRP